MKPKRIFLYIILMFTIKVNCQNNLVQKDTLNIHTNELLKSIEKPTKVSISELINSPKKYYGKLIQVYGYLKLDLNESLLFNSQESFETKNTKNAVQFFASREDIYLMQQKFKSQYVLITAKFGRVENTEYVGALYWIKSIDIVK